MLKECATTPDSVSLAGLELESFLHELPKCWDCRCSPTVQLAMAKKLTVPFAQMRRMSFQARWTGPVLPTCPVIPAVCHPEDPWVLLHRHECRVKLRGWHCSGAWGDLNVSEAKFSIVFCLLEPWPHFFKPPPLPLCAPSSNKDLREI